MTRRHDDFPYAEQKRIKADWIRDTGFKESPSYACIRPLLRKRCKRDGYCCFPPGADHTSLWRWRSKAICFVSQPYDLSLETKIHIDAFCFENPNLLTSIDVYPSWHYPGWTRMLIYWRKAMLEYWWSENAERLLTHSNFNWPVWEPAP